MMGSVTLADSGTLLRRVKVIGILMLVAATVAILAHAATAAPQLFGRPAGNQQQLRRAPDEPVRAPEPVRKRPLRLRPVPA
jgi:hypothetical protein